MCDEIPKGHSLRVSAVRPLPRRVQWNKDFGLRLVLSSDFGLQFGGEWPDIATRCAVLLENDLSQESTAIATVDVVRRTSSESGEVDLTLRIVSANPSDAVLLRLQIGPPPSHPPFAFVGHPLLALITPAFLVKSLSSEASLSQHRAGVASRQPARIISFNDIPSPLFLCEDLQSGGTGGTVWDSALALAAELAPRLKGKRVLELGAGTGIVGLALAMAGALVTMTDGSEEVVEQLKLNATINGVAHAVSIATLIWEDAAASVEETLAYDAIVACECVYAEASLQPLLQTICNRLGPGGVVYIAWRRGRALENHSCIMSRLQPMLHLEVLEFSCSEMSWSSPDMVAFAGTLREDQTKKIEEFHGPLSILD